MRADRPYNVLFLCTGNSGRSILAEAILNHLGAPRFRAFSAGSRPKGRVQTEALSLLESFNIETEGLRSKSWDAFAAAGALEFDFVFTLCDSAAQEPCPVWPGRPISAHWGAPDPAASEDARVWTDVYRTLQSRIVVFCALPFEALDAPTLRLKLAEIGRM